jgi:ribose 1,5-bisphosphokinase
MSSLFYVIGPSGAGKDALMNAARQALDGEAIAFAHRYITRPASAGGENFIGLTPAEFAVRDTKGLFWLTWASHELHYAVGREVLTWLTSGVTVVVNGSRAHLAQVQAQCDLAAIPLIPVWVHCDALILAQRLRSRGRESETQIAERLLRATQFMPPAGALVIDNSDKLEQALADWLVYLKQAIHDG